MSALAQNRPGESESKKKYEVYLTSAEWRAKRWKVLERDGNCCKVCCSPKNLQVHHLTYRNIFAEPLEDLVTWCDKCHTAHHKTKRKKQRAMRRNRRAWHKNGSRRKKQQKSSPAPKKTKWPDIPLRMSMKEYERSLKEGAETGT